MEWMEAPTLLKHLPTQLSDRERLRRLSDAFLNLSGELRNNKIAHGDLQHGNLLVSGDVLKIIDYDGMCVPGTNGLSSVENGLPPYQHPRRNGGKLNLSLDHFSSLVIWTSLYALSLDSSLWRQHIGDAERLLFQQSDFISPQNSQIFKKLLTYKDTRLTKAVSALHDACFVSDLEKIPHIEDVLAEKNEWWKVDGTTESRKPESLPDWINPNQGILETENFVPRDTVRYSDSHPLEEGWLTGQPTPVSVSISRPVKPPIPWWKKLNWIFPQRPLAPTIPATQRPATQLPVVIPVAKPVAIPVPSISQIPHTQPIRPAHKEISILSPPTPPVKVPSISQTEILAVSSRRAGEEQEFEIAPGVEIAMCWIPPGEFMMGSLEYVGGRQASETQHRVTLTQGLWLGKYPVTQSQWEAVMGNNPSHFRGSNLPVEEVSWDDISRHRGFMEMVNRFAGVGGYFSLPTEAQWEYACRAGTTTALNNGKNLTTDEGVCPNLDEVAWYRANSGKKTHPVGQKKANVWGLHDMHGNVWEWCMDWYKDYTDGAQVDPRGPDTDTGRFLCRVYRGGGWGNYANRCRAAYRGNRRPGYSYNAIGFRLARSQDPQ